MSEVFTPQGPRPKQREYKKSMGNLLVFCKWPALASLTWNNMVLCVSRHRTDFLSLPSFLLSPLFINVLWKEQKIWSGFKPWFSNYLHSWPWTAHFMSMSLSVLRVDLILQIWLLHLCVGMKWRSCGCKGGKRGWWRGRRKNIENCEEKWHLCQSLCFNCHICFQIGI